MGLKTTEKTKVMSLNETENMKVMIKEKKIKQVEKIFGQNISNRLEKGKQPLL